MPFGQERVLVYTKSNHNVSLVPRKIVDSKSNVVKRHSFHC